MHYMADLYRDKKGMWMSISASSLANREQKCSHPTLAI